MESGLITVLPNIVLPLDLAGVPVDSEEDAVTRPDEYYIPRDRGIRRYSAAGLKLPKDVRIRCVGFIVP